MIILPFPFFNPASYSCLANFSNPKQSICLEAGYLSLTAPSAMPMAKWSVPIHFFFHSNSHFFMAENSTSFLDRSRTVAGPGYSRWLVPPAALAIHLAIGQAYAFSVFKKPMGALISLDVDNPAPNDWTPGQLAVIFSIAIVLLGLSAAVFGKWLERVGPRKAMLASALCFGGGFLISALGVSMHQIWLVYFGYGFVGGIGLGIGYI